ncbi:MAG TPA: sigma 54-interacting transcriptional regulator, partial [Thermoanaerobaculia bacterium]|nr:sigma 54-interacting transcriptional regulator [Thermoanaerobaculia bacterium]
IGRSRRMGPKSENRLETQTWSTPKGEPSPSLTVPGLTILGHPQIQRVGERAALLDLSSGRAVLLSRGEPGFAPPGEPALRPLAVPYLSRRPWLLESTAGGGVRLLRGGSPIPLAANGEPVDSEATFSADEVDRGVVVLLASHVVLLLHRFRPVFPGSLPRYGLVGLSDPLLDLCRQIARVADLQVPVLLRGESGTGKELVAAALHRASSRRNGPFLALNMGALPASLAAAELFGAARGAYTGAEHARRGTFRRAHGGTLFLDEIGETPQETQPLLLRALESGEVQPLGSEETARVDVRVLAATDADLEQAVADGRFRAPLLHRLGGYAIRLPALRERRDDIGRLFFHFLREELAEMGEERRLTDPGPEAQPWPPAAWIARLAAAPWPGNVRQLRNVARSLAIDSRGTGEDAAEARFPAAIEELLHGERPPPGSGPAARPAAPAPTSTPARTAFRSPQDVSEEELLAALAANRWQPRATAHQLGISRPSLYFLLDAFPSTRKAMDLSVEEIAEAGERCGGRPREMAALLHVSEAGIRRRMKQLGLLSILEAPAKPS